MIISMARWVTGREHDQPLMKAARVALEANQTPRVRQSLIVDQDGAPIEIPNGEPLSQLSLLE